jgi:hypothetical protein
MKKFIENIESKNPKDYSIITFRKLKKISNRNHGRYNRNIDTELLEEHFPNIKNKVFRIENVMEHHHFRGELVDKHYRCIVHIPEVDQLLFQDVSEGQWGGLKNSEYRIKNIPSVN